MPALERAADDANAPCSRERSPLQDQIVSRPFGGRRRTRARARAARSRGRVRACTAATPRRATGGDRQHWTEGRGLYACTHALARQHVPSGRDRLTSRRPCERRVARSTRHARVVPRVVPREAEARRAGSRASTFVHVSMWRLSLRAVSIAAGLACGRGRGFSAESARRPRAQPPTGPASIKTRSTSPARSSAGALVPPQGGGAIAQQSDAQTLTHGATWAQRLRTRR
jgi:hypothetical protein